MTSATDIKNAELTLDSIRQDTVKALEELTAALKAKDKVTEDVAQMRNDLQVEKNNLELEKQAVADEKTRVAQERSQAQKIVERAKEEKAVIDAQRATAMTELRRLNDWIFAAQEDKKGLETTLKSLYEEIEQKRKVTEELRELQDKIESARDSYREILVQSSLATDSAEQAVLALEKRATEAEERAKEATQIRSREEIALFDIISNKETIRRDVSIIVRRIEEIHNKELPEARMLIAKLE